MVSPSARIKIYKAAKDLFASRGFHQVSLGDISKESGVTLNSLKKTYKSTTELLHELINEGIREGSEVFTTIFNQRGKADVKISRLVRTLMDKYEKNFPLYKLISLSLDSTDPDAEHIKGAMTKEQLEKYRSNTAILGRLMAQGQSEGVFGDFDPLEAAYLLRGMISAAVRYWQICKKDSKLSDHADTVTRMFLKGALR